MKKILVVNPNTSGSMTESIRKTISMLNEGNEVIVVNPEFGPKSLESFYDYQIAAFEIIKMIQNSTEEFDGILVSCFGDPGLYAIKEMSACPVVGIAEASLSASLLLGKKFAILTALDKAVPMMEDMVDQYGLSLRMAAVKAVNSNVLDIENDRDKLLGKFIEVGKLCIEEGAEVLILGCASMTGLQEKMENELKLPVIDPVIAGYKMLEMILDSNMKISKKGLYMNPPKGLYRGDV